MKEIKTNFNELSNTEQVKKIAELMGVELSAGDVKEAEKFTAFELLADEETQNKLKSKKVKRMLKSARDIAEIFALAEVKQPKFKIEKPSDIIKFVKTILNQPNEKAIAIFLAPTGAVIDYEVISEGTADKTPVFPSKIVKGALTKNAKGVIIAHSHPAGADTEPSPNDVKITKIIEMGLSFIEVQLLDHIIVSAGTDDYFSFNNHDLI